MLLIPAGGEDAEWWRPVAERLIGHTVVTYDRRGTGRSGREDWPGRGSVQHADDAASLLGDLGLHEVVVFGNSSAGVVALQLAIRHPGRVRRALVFEPGHLRQVAGGDELHRRMREAAAEHLAANPNDWSGAAAATVLPERASGSGTGSGATSNVASPSTISGTRLVASTCSRGHADDSSPTSSAHAATRCSQLSSTTSRCRD